MLRKWPQSSKQEQRQPPFATDCMLFLVHMPMLAHLAILSQFIGNTLWKLFRKEYLRSNGQLLSEAVQLSR